MKLQESQSSHNLLIDEHTKISIYQLFEQKRKV